MFCTHREQILARSVITLYRVFLKLYSVFLKFMTPLQSRAKSIQGKHLYKYEYEPWMRCFFMYGPIYFATRRINMTCKANQSAGRYCSFKDYCFHEKKKLKML